MSRRLSCLLATIALLALTPVRWSVATGAGLILALTSLGTISPVTAAPSDPAAPVAQDRVIDVPAQRIFSKVIDPDDFECEPTAIDDYVGAQIDSWTLAELLFVIPHQDVLFGVPTYAALFFGTAGDPAYALGSHAAQLRNTFRDVKKFWSGSEEVQSDDIQLMAMHGDVLLDADVVEATLLLMQEYELLSPPLDTASPAQIRAEAMAVATFLQQNVAGGRALYDDPLWTLNAYAFSGEDETDPFLQSLPDKMVFGDGFLDFMEAIGLGDAGPRVVMGHEFAHHIQFELGLFESDLEGPEATRRTELMADAYAAYYGVHKRGLALNAKRVADALFAFYVVGDCSFDSDGHHGTPNQRERAAEWGAELAMASHPNSAILDAREFAELFDSILPMIVAPDAA
ncbi:hypothetical protein SFC88_10110 [Nocardioides sp. HM23]|uniref:hypothetical protein n=1 Tax=Nocardioides bizhenqiangii TaxID=3095076 RepID=UPI002ACAEEC4|nr:hypothetical protein [Nocardioides sp. HM23]MDZ5621182.1 hypothetical protein [Nocardioides sp. HM23]